MQSTLGSINVKTFGNGGAQANLTAQTLTKLTVSQLLNSAVIQAGTGGVSSAFIQASQNAALSSAGNIGTVVVQGAASNTGIAANRSPGSDGILGTLDDYTINSSATPTITSVQFNGAVSTAGYGVQVITTASTTPPVTGTGGANVESVDNAMSTYIPLQIEQATAGITGFDDDEIWIAVYGQEISTETNPPANPLSYYLDALNLSGSGATAAPIPISTTTLVVDPNTPNQAILPSYTLAQWKNVAKTWGSNLQFPVPAIGNEYTGRILISVGAPVQAQVTTASPYTVAAPTPASAIDASNGTFYDFLEFTVSNLTPAKGGLTLDMDTSQVDSFGLPMQLQFFQDTAGTQPYNVAFQGTVTPGNASITGVTNVSLLKTGQPIVGSGIEPGSLISQINGTTIVLNKAATSANPATPVLTSLTAQNAGPVGVQITRQEVIDPSSSDSLMAFLQTQLDDGYDNARPFLQTAAPYQISGPVPIVGAQATNGGTITIYTNSTAGLNVNDQVAIYGVGGITNANGLYTVGAVDHGANTFTLLNSSGNGTYTQGGVWQIAITGATVGASPDYEITISTTNVSGLNVGDIIQIVNVSGMTSANGFFIVAAINANTFTLEGSNGQGQTFTLGPQGPGTLAGTWSVYTNGPRVVAPDDIVSQLPAHTSPNGLNNYFNELIDEFFLTYLPSSQSVVGGDGISRTGGGATLSVTTTAGGANYAGTYSGTVQNLGTGTNQGYALVLTNSTLGKTFVIYYPFSTANAPSPNVYLPKFPLNGPQTWQVANQLQFTSGSEMVFGCTGVFADNVFRATAFNKDNNWSAVLGDLENSVASAFNRGIALNDSTTWSDSSHWFQQTAAPLTPSRPSPSQASELYGVYNYWVEYWHQNGIAINDLAYAYPYDDKYGASTNMQVENVGLAQVLLNQWSTTQNIQTTTAFGNATTIPATPSVSPGNPTQGSQVTLTATVAANSGGVTPTGTLTFFIDGVPINSDNFSATPPQQPVTLTPTATAGTAVASITATLPARTGRQSHAHVHGHFRILRRCHERAQHRLHAAAANRRERRLPDHAGPRRDHGRLNDRRLGYASRRRLQRHACL